MVLIKWKKRLLIVTETTGRIIVSLLTLYTGGKAITESGVTTNEWTLSIIGLVLVLWCYTPVIKMLIGDKKSE